MAELIDVSLMSLELRTVEAERFTVYDDKTGTPLHPGTMLQGHPTIGVGRALDLRGITRPESAIMLANDIALYTGELANYDWWMALDPVRRRAIVNMRHQIGLDGLLEF